jgi:hypothetical protein
MASEPTAVGPPDFVGVGVQRSGTTWWHEALLAHPQIRPPRTRRKELHFFAGFGARAFRGEDIDAYHRLFPREAGEIAGEWTPRYMAEMWTPRLLARAAPDAKLLVMLRDPIERYRSGVRYAISRTPHRVAEVMAAEAVERGRYGHQLRRLYRFFAPGRVLVQQYERCCEDPVTEYRRTLRFLGVADDFTPDLERPRGTTVTAHKTALAADVHTALVAALENEVRALTELVPDFDLSHWANFAHLAAAADARP